VLSVCHSDVGMKGSSRDDDGESMRTTPASNIQTLNLDSFVFAFKKETHGCQLV